MLYENVPCCYPCIKSLAFSVIFIPHYSPSFLAMALRRLCIAARIQAAPWTLTHWISDASGLFVRSQLFVSQRWLEARRGILPGKYSGISVGDLFVFSAKVIDIFRPFMHSLSMVNISGIALERCSVSGLQISILQRAGIRATGMMLPLTVQCLRRPNVSRGELFHKWTTHQRRGEEKIDSMWMLMVV